MNIFPPLEPRKNTATYYGRRGERECYLFLNSIVVASSIRFKDDIAGRGVIRCGHLEIQHARKAPINSHQVATIVKMFDVKRKKVFYRQLEPYKWEVVIHLEKIGG